MVLRRLSLVTLTLCLSGFIFFGCHYKYVSKYNFARENAAYLDSIETTAFAALQNDSRIAAILNGTDANAKTQLQTLLDKISALKSHVDGVAYVALIEGLMADADVNASNIQSELATIESILTAMASSDDAKIIAGAVRDDAAADAARAAMTAYAQNRSPEAMNALIERYAQAIGEQRKNVVGHAPITSALIFAGSSHGTAAPDNIDTTTADLAHIGRTTSGDTDVEKQLSGTNLISFVKDQITSILSAAENKNYVTQNDEANLSSHVWNGSYSWRLLNKSEQYGWRSISRRWSWTT